MTIAAIGAAAPPLPVLSNNSAQNTPLPDLEQRVVSLIQSAALPVAPPAVPTGGISIRV